MPVSRTSSKLSAGAWPLVLIYFTGFFSLLSFLAECHLHIGSKLNFSLREWYLLKVKLATSRKQLPSQRIGLSMALRSCVVPVEPLEGMNF
jgi:hypothetical protein